MRLIELQTRDPIATLTLNRADKVNAISDDLRTRMVLKLDLIESRRLRFLKSTRA